MLYYILEFNILNYILSYRGENIFIDQPQCTIYYQLLFSMAHDNTLLFSSLKRILRKMKRYLAVYSNDFFISDPIIHFNVKGQ